jgi:hypothetical protein
MRKLASLLVVAGMVAFVACGPSAEQLAEQARLDSLKQDSIAKAQADSVAKVAAIEKAKQDSIAAAEAVKAHEDSVAKGLIKGAKKAKK